MLPVLRRLRNYQKIIDDKAKKLKEVGTEACDAASPKPSTSTQTENFASNSNNDQRNDIDVNIDLRNEIWNFWKCYKI